MVRRLSRRERRYQRAEEARNAAAARGCLRYVVVFLIVMLVLAFIFGRFHKGHKYTGSEAPPRPPFGVSQAAAYPADGARTALI